MARPALVIAAAFAGGVLVGVAVTRATTKRATVQKSGSGKSHWKKKSERKKERRAQRLAVSKEQRGGAAEAAKPVDWNQIENKCKQLRTINGKSKEVEFDEAGTEFRLLRKAETVLQKRTSRIILVLERCSQVHNYTAVIRTAECMGVQHIWVIDPPHERHNIHQEDRWEEDEEERKKHIAYARQATQWVDIRAFSDTSKCLKALKQEKYTIWATDLSQEAVSLTDDKVQLPPKLAVVMGTESTGCSAELLNAADQRVYIPLYGFADSLNLSVAAAMVIQRLLFICPEAIGEISDKEKASLRRKWYAQLGRTPDEKQMHLSMCDNPPPPLGDVRRPDEHRSGWASKKVKRNAAARSSTESNEENIQARAMLTTEGK